MKNNPFIAKIKGLEFYRLDFHINKQMFFPFNLFEKTMCNELIKEKFNKKFNITLSYEKGSNFDLYFEKHVWNEIGELIINKLTSKEYYEQLKNEIENKNISFSKFITKIENKKLERINDALQIYRKFIKEIVSFRTLAIIPNCISMGKKVITEEYRKLIQTNISNKDFTLLSSSEEISMATQAEKELLEMIRDNKTKDNNIKDWIHKWGFIYYYYAGPVPTMTEVKDMIKSLSQTYKHPEIRIKEIESHTKNISKEKEKIIKELKLREEEIHLFKVISFFNLYKQLRKELMQKSYVAMDKVFNYLSSETKLSVDELKFLTLEEVEELAKSKKERFVEKIKRRQEELLYVTTSNEQTIIEDKKQIKKIIDKIKFSLMSQKMLVAFNSKKPVKGRLIIINSKEDMKKVENLKEQFILASGSTYPELLPAMAKSAGIITKIGGMTSHAAIVAREMKKPCIVGYAELFKDFKEGDMIEMNTDKCSVRKL